MSSLTPLPAPIVSLASDGTLDPDLVGPYLEVEVPTSTCLVPSARCTLRIASMGLQGSEILWEEEDQLPIGEDGESLWFYCKKAVIDALLDETAVFSYTIAPDAHSANLVLAIGQPVTPGRLPPPEIDDLVGNVLDAGLPRARVIIPVSAASLKGATATLSLRTDDSRLMTERSRILNMAPPTLAKDLVQASKSFLDNLTPLPFTFRGYPAAHDGMEVEAYYEIAPADGTMPSISESNFFLIGEPLDLSEPLIEEAQGDLLDIDSFTGAAHITTEPNERIKAEQYYWAYLASDTDEGPVFFPVKMAGQVTPAEATAGLRIPIPREVLDLLPNGSTIRVQIAINLTGTDDPFDAADFPEKTYLVAVAGNVSWDLEDLVPENYAPISKGETLSFDLMNITLDEDYVGTAKITVEKFGYTLPDYYSGVVINIGGPVGTLTDCVARIVFKRAWNKVRFAVTSLNGTLYVDWHSVQAEPQRLTITGGDVTAGHDVQSDLGQITAVVLHVKDGIRLDCFRMER